MADDQDRTTGGNGTQARARRVADGLLDGAAPQLREVRQRRLVDHAGGMQRDVLAVAVAGRHVGVNAQQ
mgnify:CR=1 FL=1